MYAPRAHINQAGFGTSLERLAKDLAPDVVRIDYHFADDWSGDPAVFFMVILSDEAANRGRLYDTASGVQEAVINRVQPYVEWGLQPYFNFRSESEQTKLDQLAAA